MTGMTGTIVNFFAVSRMLRVFRRDPMLLVLVVAVIVAFVLVMQERRKEGYATLSDDIGYKVRGYCRKRGLNAEEARKAAKEQYNTDDTYDPDQIDTWCNRGIAMHEARRRCKYGESMESVKDTYKNHSDMTKKLSEAEADWACRMGWKQRSKEYNTTKNRDEGACEKTKTYCPNMMLRKTKPCQGENKDFCCELGGSGCVKITQSMTDRADAEWNKQKEGTRPGEVTNKACKPKEPKKLQGCTFYKRSWLDNEWKCWQGHKDTGLGKGGEGDTYYKLQCATNVKCKNRAQDLQQSEGGTVKKQIKC